MLIEQIIEFELRGPGPPGRTCTPTTGQLHDKIKIFEENLLLGGNAPYFPVQGPNHLQ